MCVYFTPEEYQYGMGYYQGTPERMNLLRDHICLHPERFATIIEALGNQTEFELVGEEYKRTISNEMSKIKEHRWLKHQIVFLKRWFCNQIFALAGF